MSATAGRSKAGPELLAAIGLGLTKAAGATCLASKVGVVHLTREGGMLNWEGKWKYEGQLAAGGSTCWRSVRAAACIIGKAQSYISHVVKNNPALSTTARQQRRYKDNMRIYSEATR